MKNILQYFDRIADVIEYSEAESAEVEFEQIDQTHGIVDGVLYFNNGSRLEFTETVAIQKPFAIKRLYRYQYIRKGRAIFRYDNAPHHPDLLNFPHHKHVGRKRLSATEPTLSQVLDEVSAFLIEEIAQITSKRKQRRQSKIRQD
jgi:hypothetical protein